MKKQYLITKAPSDVSFHEDTFWADVPSLSIEERLWTPPVDISASAQICYNERALYVRLSAKEKDIRATHTTSIGMPCEDSCLEFFFSPDQKRYINIECNPNGCLFVGIGKSGRELLRLVTESGSLAAPQRFDVQTRLTEGGWQADYHVPLSFLNLLFPEFALTPGTLIPANCYKCGDLTPVPHFFAWNKVESETPDFHRLCDFGEMVLQLP